MSKRDVAPSTAYDINNIPEKVILRFHTKYERTESCWLWKGILNDDGYGFFNLGRPCRTAHRIMWSIVNGPIPSDKQVLHKCDVRNCVNPDHLFLGTQLENIQDRTKKGRSFHSIGELSGRAKLTNRDAIEIRKKYSSGKYTRLQIAKEYGVCIGTIKNIVYGRTYGLCAA